MTMSNTINVQINCMTSIPSSLIRKKRMFCNGFPFFILSQFCGECSNNASWGGNTCPGCCLKSSPNMSQIFLLYENQGFMNLL